MIVTTLNKIKEHNPCKDGWETLLKNLGKTKADDESLSFLTILESNGFDDALWCMKAAPEYNKEWKLFGVWCARQVQHLIEDQLIINTLDVAEKFANGLATKDELAEAWSAAWAEAWSAASDAARYAASDSAWAAASDSAWAAARAEARDAAKDAASDSERSAAWDEAWDEARDAQKKQLIKIISGERNVCSKS